MTTDGMVCTSCGQPAPGVGAALDPSHVCAAPAPAADPGFEALVDALVGAAREEYRWAFSGSGQGRAELKAARSALVSAWEALRARLASTEETLRLTRDGADLLVDAEERAQAAEARAEAAEERLSAETSDRIRCQVGWDECAENAAATHEALRAEVARERAAREAAERERDDVLEMLETLRAHFLGRLDAGDTTPILFCGWCGTPVTGPEAFKAHAPTCEKNPPVRRALDAEAALAGILAVADGDHCACGDPACVATREAWDRARALAGPGAATAAGGKETPRG